jgi:hypothetical protein
MAESGREVGSDLKFSAVFGTMSSNSSNTRRSTLPPPAWFHNAPLKQTENVEEVLQLKPKPSTLNPEP